jgi:hypothetical protein
VPLTPALLRLDPMFDPLRNDMRFQKLVASPTPKNHIAATEARILHPLHSVGVAMARCESTGTKINFVARPVLSGVGTVVESDAKMTMNHAASPYALGSTDAEHERLIRQAARLAPLTERLFREAGIGPEQRLWESSATGAPLTARGLAWLKLVWIM